MVRTSKQKSYYVIPLWCISCIFSFKLHTTSRSVSCFFFFFTSFLPPFASIISSQIKPSHLPPFPSLEALAPLAGSLPLGVLAEKLSLIHPQRALWLTRLAQGRRAELREEGRAVSTELSNDRGHLLQRKDGAALVKLFKVQTVDLGLWFLWARQKMWDWSGRNDCRLPVCLEKNTRERERETHMQSHLEEPLTPHTFIASPIRSEGGRKGELQKGRGGKSERKRGRDVFHKCSSIKSTDPNGIQ